MGGGIPILRSLREGFAANRILSLHGIMNGTTNYVLTEMEKTGELFDDRLLLSRDGKILDPPERQRPFDLSKLVKAANKAR